jgi:hypothetical protein
MAGDTSALMKGMVIVGLIVQAAVIVWLFQLGGEPDSGDGERGVIPTPKEPRGCGALKVPSPSSGVLIDDGARIAIEVPEEWDGHVSGSLVKLEKDNGRATISAGLGPSGGLPSALEELGSSLGRSYGSVQIVKRARLEVDGCPARSLVGYAVNQEGAGLRFEAMVVAGPEDTFAIAGFLESGSEPGLAKEVRRMIRSIRILAPRSIS